MSNSRIFRIRLPGRSAWLPRAVAAAVGVLFLATARPAAAAADPFATWMGLPAWVWMLANLVIFFGALGYYLGPPIARFLEDRGRQIREELEEAHERRAAASDLQSSLAAKVAQLEEQIDQLLERAEREGRREHDELLAQAEREKERLLSQAEGEIEHRVQQARQELKDYTTELAARLARERLESELGPEERQRLFRRNLSRLEREAS
jgi:F-type H+-transporting ATPase subunit b